MFYRCLLRSSRLSSIQYFRCQQFSSTTPTLLSQTATDKSGESSKTTKAEVSDSPLSKIRSHIFLRDSCKCPKCVDQSTQQREFSFADIPVNIEGKATKSSDGESWEIRWTNDIPGFRDHVSIFTPDQLARLRFWQPPAQKRGHRSSLAVWDLARFRRETQKISYADFMGDDNALAQALYLLARHGLVFVADVPRDSAACRTLAERIAPLRNTFYGETWDVKSQPDAKNVAYTSKYLGFHTDLMYMNETPSIQLLHCIDNSCKGGESRYVDGFKALDTLAAESPEKAKALSQMSIRYEYDNNGQFYSATKPVIQQREATTYPIRKHVGFECKERQRGQPEMRRTHRLHWSPQFVGSIDATYNTPGQVKLEEKLIASKAFAEILERPELVFEEKVEPGTCAIFNNQRVLHARNAFDINSGSRWLRGCYLDEQDVISKELSMSDKISQLDDAMAARDKEDTRTRRKARIKAVELGNVEQ